MSMTSSQAQALVSSAMRAASDAGLAVSVAVLDSAGFLLAFSRADGAKPYTVDVAIGKAYAAIYMGRSSDEVRDLADARPHFFAAIKGLGLRTLIPSPGGLAAPGGAIGVSGAANPDQDVAIANAALSELKSEQEGAAE